jgi:hypothetical protein
LYSTNPDVFVEIEDGKLVKSWIEVGSGCRLLLDMQEQSTNDGRGDKSGMG